MKLNYITIMVRDLEKSLEFYCGLISLKKIREMNPPQGKIVFLADREGDTMLELIQMDQAEKVTATGIVISFLAKKPLAEIKEHAKAMGYDSADIIMQPPKPAHFTVTDPDGLIIEISEN
ncbi:MAG: VOC family protein [Lachnospiraceae bacterium]